MDQQKKLAEIARDLATTSALSFEEVYERLIQGVQLTQLHLQKMIDSVVAIQDKFPMPAEGWEQFKRDIRHTNEKHGFSLYIKVEEKNG